MGANVWRHSPSLGAMHGGVPMRLYFSSQKNEGLYSLANRQPPSDSLVTHEVDLADRVKFHNYHAYPDAHRPGAAAVRHRKHFPERSLSRRRTVISGAFTGELTVVINKKDFDLGVTVYEAMPDGKLFHLGYAMHRASYARGSARSGNCSRRASRST